MAKYKVTLSYDVSYSANVVVDAPNMFAANLIAKQYADYNVVWFDGETVSAIDVADTVEETDTDSRVVNAERDGNMFPYRYVAGPLESAYGVFDLHENKWVVFHIFSWREVEEFAAYMNEKEKEIQKWQNTQSN